MELILNNFEENKRIIYHVMPESLVEQSNINFSKIFDFMMHLPQIISDYSFSSKDRFLKYVKIDTQSDPKSTTSPSTEKQKDLALLLVKELHDLGISNAHTNEYGYVYAHLESNVSKDVPAICFCAHMDTSPDCSGEQVKPIVHTYYHGQDLVLPDDLSVIIRLNEHPDLTEQIGNDIITASGTTLLGADNKAGVAEIMDAVSHPMKTPMTPAGIKILRLGALY